AAQDRCPLAWSFAFSSERRAARRLPLKISPRKSRDTRRSCVRGARLLPNRPRASAASPEVQAPPAPSRADDPQFSSLTSGNHVRARDCHPAKELASRHYLRSGIRTVPMPPSPPRGRSGGRRGRTSGTVPTDRLLPELQRWVDSRVDFAPQSLPCRRERRLQLPRERRHPQQSRLDQRNACLARVVARQMSRKIIPEPRRCDQSGKRFADETR